ncbi:MAG: phosphate acyltransferase [Pseudomonadales bacterium]|jgi:phosphate acyltransferase|uniref:phosphate acyltransferase PlsX n=1 Tax=unclassified Ketobacter TaxID=2639109 RepID=UPI000C95A4A3|nr:MULTISPECIES: phosphate acyltransferase PlsX [unclassified Ketobacter]MAQ26236.1 phosphate acyltransferase [Pseudomonadales bacterium]MEC8809925.1 phosphate acyltransferase PlsX [Pseudomonadota bacterium]TNC90353.1 MAG: phosphate acyltransferase [Alcanivorax sp.]HAG92783.1 phosphate acyltransferase PlsX [Gammaproteobacteria bacterium]MCK5791777.1 phosphate acyltransferase PlsX [Ketobacter sp.]|tara:strand:- start:73343 stop:74332 length:990 start_codon:yes stop_codon:yes gene_type:complete
MVTLAVDAMGGDFGPDVTVPAVLRALSEQQDLRVLLFGNKNTIQSLLGPRNVDRLVVRHTEQDIGMSESPAIALRTKKQSSMALMLQAVRDGDADGCVSAGNTGALMVLSRHILKTTESIDRPAIISALPREDGKHTFVLDLGANVGCDSEQLYQFAVMGQAVAQVLDDTRQPSVALLNIGSEEIKGNDQVRAANDLLREDTGLNYIGYVEGSDLFRAKADVVVCDGFVGNVALKTIEGLARYVMSEVRREFRQNWWSRLLGLLVLPLWKKVEERINPSGYNGAAFVGLRGVVVKSHGNADAYEFNQAILSARQYVDKNLPQKIENLLS